LIDQTFLPWEVECIKRITVSNYSNMDALIWPLSQDGKYSVKTTYQILASKT